MASLRSASSRMLASSKPSSSPLSFTPASRSLSLLASHRQAVAAPRPAVRTHQARALPCLRDTSSIQVRGLLKKATSGSSSAWAAKGDMSYSELKPETEAPSGEITLIDVREPNETAQGMIPSAVNVPLTEFTRAFNPSDESDFERKYAFPRPGYEDKVVVYCRSGKRSTEAQEYARKMGWKNVRNYKGSWLDWVQQEEAAVKK